MSKHSNAQLAAAELAYRTPAKADRGTRPAHIPSEIIALGGAALRAMAGTLADAAPTATEARTAENARKAAERKASTPARVTSPVTGESRAVVTQTQACRLAADLLRASGRPVPRALEALAKGKTLTQLVK